MADQPVFREGHPRRRVGLGLVAQTAPHLRFAAFAPGSRAATAFTTNHSEIVEVQINGSRVLGYSILGQLDRPNRPAVLESWIVRRARIHWQGLATTADFIAQIEPLLGSPFDADALCGETRSDGAGVRLRRASGNSSNLTDLEAGLAGKGIDL